MPTTRTYTLLLTITDDIERTADEVANITAMLWEDKQKAASAQADAFNGDALEAGPAHIRRLSAKDFHRDLRENT